MTKTDNKIKKAEQQNCFQPQHDLHVQLPRKIVEEMLEKRRVSGVTMRDQIILALESKGVGV